MLLLFIIYLAFISLGLPDAVLGASWPVMGRDINASLEFAGVCFTYNQWLEPLFRVF